MTRLRLIAAALLTLGLLWPAWAGEPDLAWQLHVWNRLKQAGRRAPDSDIDAANRALLSYLPPAAPVGFSVASLAGRTPADQQHLEQFLQYSIAPRPLVLSIDPDFVIESGPPAGPASLAHDPSFVLVVAINDDLRLFRRVKR